MAGKRKRGAKAKGGLKLWQWAVAAGVFAVLWNCYAAATAPTIYTGAEKEARAREMQVQIDKGMDMLQRLEFDAADAHWKQMKKVFRKEEGVLAQMHGYESETTNDIDAFEHWEHAIWFGHYQTYGRREQHRRIRDAWPDPMEDAPGWPGPTDKVGWPAGRAVSPLALGNGTCSIPRRNVNDLSMQEFLDEYVDQGKPVLLYGDGLVTGKVWDKWSKTGFLEAYGEREVTVVGSAQVSDGKMGEEHVAALTYQDLTIKKFVEEYMGNAGEQALHNPPYLFKEGALMPDAYHDFEHPELFNDRTRFSWNEQRRIERALFFLGVSNSGVYWHLHKVANNAVIYGRKRWFLLAPSVNPGPLKSGGMTMVEWIEKYYDEKKPLDCVQEAGTILHIPEGWHHATLNLENTIGIAIESGKAKLWKMSNS
jgi:hypothetical protein